VGFKFEPGEKLYIANRKPLDHSIREEASLRQLEPYSSLSREKLYPAGDAPLRVQIASGPIGTRNAACLRAPNHHYGLKIARVEKFGDIAPGRGFSFQG
jgi:hypothetical protein